MTTNNSIAEKNKLLDHTTVLNKQLESNYIALGIALLEVQETEAFREAGYEDFASYYRNELGREKSTVSRLLGVARWLKENKLPEATVSYRKLDVAIRAYPNKDAGYILAAAENNTIDELRDEHRESVNGVCTEHIPLTICKTCRAML